MVTLYPASFGDYVTIVICAQHKKECIDDNSMAKSFEHNITAPSASDIYERVRAASLRCFSAGTCLLMMWSRYIIKQKMKASDREMRIFWPLESYLSIDSRLAYQRDISKGWAVLYANHVASISACVSCVIHFQIVTGISYDNLLYSYLHSLAYKFSECFLVKPNLTRK